MCQLFFCEHKSHISFDFFVIEYIPIDFVLLQQFSLTLWSTPNLQQVCNKQNKKKKYFMHELTTMKQLGEKSHRYLHPLSQLMSRTLYMPKMHFYVFLYYCIVFLLRLIFLLPVKCSSIFESECLAANNNGFKIRLQNKIE